MNKFILFNGNLYNTNHIVSLSKEESPTKYAITLTTVNKIIRQWFNEFNEREQEFDNLSKQLLNN